MHHHITLVEIVDCDSKIQLIGTNTKIGKKKLEVSIYKLLSYWIE